MFADRKQPIGMNIAPVQKTEDVCVWRGKNDVLNNCRRGKLSGGERRSQYMQYFPEYFPDHDLIPLKEKRAYGQMLVVCM
eukprot:scaffold1968_cov89-Skeletonema_dohrnii-CCMP3373.AAC.5